MMEYYKGNFDIIACTFVWVSDLTSLPNINVEMIMIWYILYKLEDSIVLDQNGIINL